VLQFQPEQPVVGAKHRAPQPVGQAQADPLVTAAAQGGRRAGVVGDATVAAAEDQDLDELVEHDPVGMRGPTPAARDRPCPRAGNHRVPAVLEVVAPEMDAEASATADPRPCGLIEAPTWCSATVPTSAE
jgi:hypothetical protein